MSASDREGSPERSRLSDEEQEQEARKSRSRRDRLQVAMTRLERCMGSAAPGREKDWLAAVNQALELLRQGMGERTDAEDGLLSDIEFSAPRLWPRVERLRREYAHLGRDVGELLTEFATPAGTEVADYRDIRERIGRLLTAIKHQQSREVDLIFEAFHRDLGVGD